MCYCTPSKRTPWCGAPNCHPPVVPGVENLAKARANLAKIILKNVIGDAEPPEGEGWTLIETQARKPHLTNLPAQVVYIWARWEGPADGFIQVSAHLLEDRPDLIQMLPWAFTEFAKDDHSTYFRTPESKID